jgi:3-methyladenine DNA glycosylase AlkC
MEIRNPKKGEGVPRETISNNCIGELTKAVQTNFSGIDEHKVLDCAISKGYFDAPMTKQLDILAAVVFEVLNERSDRVIRALIESSDEKVNAVAVSVISALYKDDLDSSLAWLKQTAALSGTWPREHSCVMLHHLFIREGVKTVLPKVSSWLLDSHEGVRRVVTEGIRPRLMMVPHIEELKKDPSVLRSVFEPLLDDPSEYVRKSVGNCMNDVSKDHPEMLLDWLEEWSNKPLSYQRQRIFSRALRTLIENGEPRAYQILDIPMHSSVELSIIQGFPSIVTLNQVIPLEVEVQNTGNEDTRIVVDLIMMAPGKRGVREFVYKLGVVDVPAHQIKRIKKTLHFVDKTTQTKEEGLYEVTYRKNSIAFQQESFRFNR